METRNRHSLVEATRELIAARNAVSDAKRLRRNVSDDKNAQLYWWAQSEVGDAVRRLSRARRQFVKAGGF
jgi:hypothetical protein